MLCCQINDLAQSQDQQYHPSPLKVRLLQTLGLKSFAINRYVFARPPPRYTMGQRKGKLRIYLQGNEYRPPLGYACHCQILTNATSSIPLLRLTPKHNLKRPLIIFSHGNGSDMVHSAKFITALASLNQAQYIAYDYTGYGCSKMNRTTAKSMCDDLENVIAWADKPLDQIILVGFSLGCFPTAKIASKYRIKAVVLVSPMMSLISLLSEHEKLQFGTFFRNDEFSTFKVIDNIEAHLMLIHSIHDELIPFKHSQLIYERYVRNSSNQEAYFVEVQNLKHNDMLAYMAHYKDNGLRREFLNFLKKVEQKPCVQFDYHPMNRKYALMKKEQFGVEMINTIEQDMETRKKKIQEMTKERLEKIRKQFQ